MSFAIDEKKLADAIMDRAEKALPPMIDAAIDRLALRVAEILRNRTLTVNLGGSPLEP